MYIKREQKRARSIPAKEIQYNAAVLRWGNNFWGFLIRGGGQHKIYEIRPRQSLILQEGVIVSSDFCRREIYLHSKTITFQTVPSGKIQRIINQRKRRIFDVYKDSRISHISVLRFMVLEIDKFTNRGIFDINTDESLSEIQTQIHTRWRNLRCRKVEETESITNPFFFLQS